jgi:F0F1-type ATP synthase membrane subunit b/b'
MAAADAKSREYENALQAAQQEVFRQREAERRTHLRERAKTLQQAREQSDAMLQNAQANLAEEAQRVKAELRTVSQSLAEEIALTVLAPEGPNGKVGGARH